MSARHAAGSRVDPDGFLPLKHIELLILMVLEAGERHGYGIRQDRPIARPIGTGLERALAREGGEDLLPAAVRRLAAQGTLTLPTKRSESLFTPIPSRGDSASRAVSVDRDERR
jgi:hypothetical protein